MDKEYVQRKIELTSGQKKAWRALSRAVKQCKKENIYFYQCLESLGGLNGNNVLTIETDVEHRGDNSVDPDCLQHLDYPQVKTTCSFADDNHFVRLK